jgi:hypothetical protein
MNENGWDADGDSARRTAALPVIEILVQIDSRLEHDAIGGCSSTRNSVF